MKNTFLHSMLILFTLVLISACKDNCINDRCTLIPDAGDCRAAIIKYYFDINEGVCKEFIWGGCEGVVPFDTREACEICDCN